jgi:hypothetical protein
LADRRRSPAGDQDFSLRKKPPGALILESLERRAIKQPAKCLESIE